MDGKFDPYATFRYRLELMAKKWYNPSTWSGKKWIFDGVVKGKKEIK